MTFYYEALAADIAWDSGEQRTAVLTALEQTDLKVAERVLNMMNKPSQFVGRVVDYNSAREHWTHWDQWQIDHPEEKERPAGIPRGRGRPGKDRAAIEIASDAWHAAVAGRKQAKLDWAAWVKSENERIRKAAADALQGWDDHVTRTKDNLSNLQNGN